MCLKFSMTKCFNIFEKVCRLETASFSSPLTCGESSCNVDFFKCFLKPESWPLRAEMKAGLPVLVLVVGFSRKAPSTNRTMQQSGLGRPGAEPPPAQAHSIKPVLGTSGSTEHFHLSVQFSSIAQSCPTLCDPMDCSTPGFPVHHQLPKLTQTHVH